MTQPYSQAGDGQLAGPASGTAPAGSRLAGSAGIGVPLSIWPGLPAHGTRDGQPCAGPVTVAAALRVIDTFSVPGDLVATVGGSPAVTEAAAAASRGVLALAASPAALARQRPGVPAALPPPGDPAAGTAELAIAGWRDPGCCGRELDGEPVEDPRRAFTACEQALRPGGILAVITSPAAPGGRLTRTAGSVVAAARAAGLVYAQHIVLARAVIDGDRLAPAAPGTGPATPGGSPVHDDLFVFTKPGGEARS